MKNIPTFEEFLNESINEAEKFKATKDFEEFLEEIDGMPEVRIKRIMGNKYIDTPGGYRDEADDYDNDIVEYMISNMGRKEFEKLKAYWDTNIKESVNEGKSFEFTFNYNTDEDDVEYIDNILMNAGVDAIAEPGLDSEEMVVKAKNAVELRKAKKAIQADGFEINEGMISPKMANGFKIGNVIKTQKGTYTITGFGSRTGATRDFEAKNEKGEQFNLRVSLRGATGIQVAAGSRNLNFPEQEEMLESVVNEGTKYTVKDFPIDSLITLKDGEVWKVVKAGMRASDSRVKSDEITIWPFNKLAKDKNVSLTIDVNLDYLNANVKKIDKK